MQIYVETYIDCNFNRIKQKLLKKIILTMC